MEFIRNNLYERFIHYRSLNENTNRLKRKCEEMNCRKEDVELKKEVEVKPGKKPKREVESWLHKAEMINNEQQNIENQVREVSNWKSFWKKILKHSCLGKLVAEKIQEVEEHYQKGSFPDGLVVDVPQGKGVIFPTTNLASGTITKRKMEEIRACLISNNDVRKIGVYGMVGSGKTTIMEHINNYIIEETEVFDSVIWVPVSEARNVKKLQEKIASALYVDISSYTKRERRAAELFTILGEKKKYLLILDGMGEAFRLEVVGIPEPTLDNGCKIVLTTRSRDVCRRMNCKDFKMELLSEGEAQNLFLDTVGRAVFHTPDLEEIAENVANKCACLPLAIIEMAMRMKGVVDVYEWRNALEELQDPTKGPREMQNVLRKLKCSYSRLKDEMLQGCLRDCALYLEDNEIERRQVIEYLIDNGRIEGTSRQANFNKGHSILNKLENDCLLESVTNGYNQQCVKMHNLIRDMVLQIQ